MTQRSPQGPSSSAPASPAPSAAILLKRAGIDAPCLRGLAAFQKPASAAGLQIAPKRHAPTFSPRRASRRRRN